MKKFYSGFLPILLIMVNGLFATLPEKQGQNEKQSKQGMSKSYKLDANDEIMKFINACSDEKIVKIMLYSKLLEKNYSLYLCETDKMIERCLTLRNKRISFSKFCRLLKGTAFFSVACGFGCFGYNGWKNNPEINFEKQCGLCFVAILASLCFVHGCSEFEKICNNFDADQQYLKAIGIKNALLSYRKDK